MQRTRAELKSFFKKNAIPTQSNFEDLIESGLNQKDDGIAKVADDALTLQGTGAEEAVLRFTRSAAGGGTPAWLIKLNPTIAPKLGLAFQDAGGTVRLFVQTGSGNVGVGTVDPKSRLHVDNGRVDITASKVAGGGGLRFDGLFSELRRAQLVISSEYTDAVLASSQLNDNHGSTLTFVTTNPADATQYRKFVVNQGNWGARKQFLEFGYLDGLAQNPHVAIGEGVTVLTLDGLNRRVGIGTRSPGQALVLAGPFNNGMQAGSKMTYGGLLALQGNAPQIDFLDSDPNHGNWSIHVNESKLYFIRDPWQYTDLVLDGQGRIGIGTATPGAKLHIASADDALLIQPATMGGGVARIKFADPDNGTGPISLEYWDNGHAALRLAGGYFIQAGRTANDAEAKIMLDQLPSSTVIIGGPWASWLYLYWKNQDGVKLRAMLAGSAW